MIRFSHNRNLLVLSSLALLWSLTIAKSPAQEQVNFGRDIRPIFSDKCFACHGPDEQTREAEFRLDVKADAFRETASGVTPIVPGDPDNSELVRRVLAHDDDQMPPASSDKQLKPAEIDTIKRWIAEGADWSEHWAFVTPVKPTPPTVKLSGSVSNPIDQFVIARLESKQLEPSLPAPPETLIRRVTFDLTGLPPSTAEVDTFLADCSNTSVDAAYEKLVDRLLDSPHYGEQMASQWLDAARYADSNGYQNDFGRDMWPWRDWVIKSFNANQPYDQFTVEQIAGDLLPDATESQIVATGFNRNHRSVTEGGSIEEEWRTENVVDRVEATATTFLGLTMGCARCHDHKYDPISQREFYQFYAFFNSIDEKGFHAETRGNVPPLITLPSEEDRQKLADIDQQIVDFEQQLKDASQENEKDDQQKQLADLKAKRAAISKSVPTTMVLKERDTPRETFVLNRGQYDQPDREQQVVPGIPEFLPQPDAAQPNNRLGLARWLVDPNNPLTARVAVNRFWQHYYGIGLLETPENFGVQSPTPEHQDLLDWLAVEFAESGWDVKALQKLIVISSTYRQTSEASIEQYQSDPKNVWLARGPRFRLSSEAIRDNALTISGLLNRKIGGPSVKPYQPEGLWKELAGGASQGPYVQDTSDEIYRRSLYIYRKRTVPPPSMTTFDAGSREVCQVARPRTNTPLQALALLNDTTYVEAARRLAERALTQADDLEQQIRFAFRTATARNPDQRELGILSRSHHKFQRLFQQTPESANQLLEVGDSKTDSTVNPTRLAAMSVVCSMILNLDETITKQ